mgnify:CR=1 FL=1
MVRKGKSLMKLFGKIIILVIFIIVILYYASAYIMPSITIINNSGALIEQAEVTLPNNRLDFGDIANKKQNTLHYSLTQNDGDYRYQFEYANNKTLKGSCGYVTNNEMHKRVIITIVQNNHVICR